LHRAVANFRTSENLRVSASIGVAHTRIGEAAEALLMRAEQALYLAKQFGRNRVEISNSAAPLRVDGAVIPMRRSAYPAPIDGASYALSLTRQLMR
jgi:predicted signal transduction protein with EAL and GGDEF domain